MKRYWLFSGSVYYANGGMDDFSEWFDTLEQAVAHRDAEFEKYCCWFHVLDTETMTIVAGGDLDGDKIERDRIS